MLNLIIIEENDESFQKYKNILEKTMFIRKETYNISQYKALNANLKLVVKDHSSPKIYFISIDNNIERKIALAKYIRKNDLDSEIIILSNDKSIFKTIYEAVPKIYQILAIDKNIAQKLSNIINTILNINFDNEKILNLGKNGIMQVYLKDIEYIYKEHDERKIIIKTPYHKFYVNNTLTGLLKIIDERFAQVHKSCIVNKTKVQFYNWNEGYILLNTNQKLLYCSKKYCEKLISN